MRQMFILKTGDSTSLVTAKVLGESTEYPTEDPTDDPTEEPIENSVSFGYRSLG